MASSSSCLNFYLLLIFSLCSCTIASKVHSKKGNYSALFSFGDSLADTGNLLLSGHSPFIGIAHPPFGETFFHKPTGRCSDGRLVVDFVAEAFGLPLLPPYLSKLKGPADFRKGVNFAVAGATALNSSYFTKKNIGFLWTNSSLNVQLGWFYHLLPSLCRTDAACKSYFKKSVFLVGEIGGNDYNYAFIQGKSIEQVKSYVPDVINAIMNAASVLIRIGAKTLVVPGNLPVGCSASILTGFLTTDKNEYDPRNGCLIRFNEFAQYHNSKLHKAIQAMRERFPHINIIYADYYNAAIRFVQTPEMFGFRKETVLRACCGGGGPYNFNITDRCGHPGAHACANPARYVNWDGIHLTEAAYEFIAKAMLNGEFMHPPIKLA
ncbi:hypothetical protein AMTRI_Chr08g165420 [Amborella trichopoda]